MIYLISGFSIFKIKGEKQMEITILITISILGLIGIKNYIKVKDLESRTEKTFIEVEKTLNALERRINNGNVR